MKKCISILLLAVLCLLAGCQGGQNEKTQNAGTVQVMQSLYYYDQGYVQAGGWRYDMTLASSEQIAHLNKLVNAMTMDIQHEEFIMGQGYYLIWRNASGSVEKEMLVLSDKLVSMQGALFSAEGGAELMAWLEALQLSEQSVGN